MKATSLFGGVQVFQIIIQIIKSKFLAVFLGTAGMGINGLFGTTTGFITAITSFGLGTSGIKSIAEAEGTGDENRIATIVSVLHKSVWLTGLLGMVVTLFLSPWLSKITFGNSDYTIAFIWLSVTFILNQLGVGQLVILQGLRKYKYLANANLTGAILGLFISLLLYYYFGINGIVPAIIGTSILNLIRSWYFGSKVKIKKVNVSKEVTVEEAKKMLKLGFVISLSGIVGTSAAYLIRIFISNYGGLDQVGLYSAGFVLLNTYVGLVFTAMGTDYFPRLSAHADDNVVTEKAVNEQAEIFFLLLTPILLAFLIFCPIILKVLYTSEFLVIDSMLYWSILGMLLRAASWSMSYVFIAKGDAKVFFLNESIASVYILLLNVAGYYFYGLTGLGVAFLVGYVLYFFQMSMLGYKLYDIKFKLDSIKILAIQFVFTGLTFLICINITNYVRYFSSIPILVGCIVYSYIHLDKRINLTSLVKDFINSRNSK